MTVNCGMTVTGSLGISVIDTQILGCERAFARSHPKIWSPSREILKNLSH